jgi:hypothetical protein
MPLLGNAAGKIKNKKGEILSNLSLRTTSSKNYFFFLTGAFLAGAFLAATFFLAAM